MTESTNSATAMVEANTISNMGSETQTTNKKQDSGARCLLLGCVLILCCCVTSLAAGLGVLAFTANAILSNLPVVGGTFDQLCDASVSDLRSVYDTNFTSAYRERVSFNEFRKLYVENTALFANCKGQFSNFSYTDLINSQINYTATTEKISLSILLKGKNVYIELVPQGNDWLVDRLEIK